MNLKSTVVLLLLVFGLGAFIWFVEQDRAGTKMQEAQARKALTLNPESVSRLSIAMSNLVVRAVLEDHNWRLEEPVQGFADNGQIRRIIQGLERLPKGDVIPAAQRERRGLKLVDYGLAVPRAQISVEQRGRPIGIWVGDLSPLGQSLFIMETNRQDIVATSTNVLSLLPADANVLRSRSLLHGVPLRAHRFELKRSAGPVQLTRREDGQWLMKQPVEGRADNAFVRDMVRKFQAARIEKFVEDEVEDFAPYGLDSPVVEAYIWPEGGGGARSVFLGRPVDGDPQLVYARADDWASVFAVPRTLLGEAELDADVLRDRRLCNLRAAAVGYVLIGSGEVTIELQKDDAGSWSLLKPVQRNADDELVWTLLNEWAGARVNAFLSGSPVREMPGAAAESERRLVFAVSVLSADPERLDLAEDEAGNHAEFLVYPNPGDAKTVIVRNPRETGSVVVDRTLTDRWSTNPLDYYDRLALLLVHGDIRSVEISRDGKEQRVEKDAAGKFQAVEDGAQVNAAAITNILNAVFRLHVDRYVEEDPKDLELFALFEPAAVLTLGLTGDAGISKSILFGGSADSEGVFTMIRGQSTVFVVPRSVYGSIFDMELVEPEPAVVESDLPQD